MYSLIGTEKQKRHFYQSLGGRKFEFLLPNELRILKKEKKRKERVSLGWEY